MRSWNVCVEHQPAHAGLYRGIQDFARALGGGVLSFDGHELEAVADPVKPAIRRIRSGQGWLARRVLAVAPSAAREADVAAAGADLLVVHSLFRAHAPWARDWALRHRQPYWVVPHGCLDPAGLARRALAKRLWLWRHGRPLFADAHAVIFATRREQAKASAWMPLRHGWAGGERHVGGVVVPWPVELPSLAGVDKARETFRRRNGIPEAAPVLLFVGRLHTTKRPRETIAAFAAADPAGSHLVVVGMEENLTRERLRAEVPAGLAGRVHIVGELRGDALAEAWLAADGYISLSAKENFGYSAADALAHGLPVILSPGHDLAYELPGAEEGRLDCGWLLPDQSLEAAAEAIREWSRLVNAKAGEPDKLRGFRTTGRNWAADNLSFERFQAALQRLAADGTR
jgi:glycosyltransferase involved in cell wall biosynthesis